MSGSDEGEALRRRSTAQLCDAAKESGLSAERLAAVELMTEARESLANGHRELCQLWAGVQCAGTRAEWARVHRKIDAIETSMDRASACIRAVLKTHDAEQIDRSLEALAVLHDERPAARELASRVKLCRASMLQRIGVAP